MTRFAFLFSVVLIVAFLTSCGDNAIQPDDVLGEWEKQEDSLPPVNLVLSREGGRLLARLRLSGVELNGTARLEDSQLYLEFPNREPMTGEFTSGSSLNLRLDKLGGQFVLKKRP